MSRPEEIALDDAALGEPSWLDSKLRCPKSGEPVRRTGDRYLAERSGNAYRINSDGCPLFAEEFSSNDARVQHAHYERIAQAYVANLGYAHTQVYTEFLDDVLREAVPPGTLGTVGEICCGAGEAFQIFENRCERGVGIDISPAMLNAARRTNPNRKFAFVQGDATCLPLADECLDTVVMLGGIHHVGNRPALFAEVARVLKPDGRFFFREPVSDFWLWRWLRALIYRLSPMLDNDTERPLLRGETEPPLAEAGLHLEHWRTVGFFGFCLLMNSDVLVFNRLFRFIPGIKLLTRLAVRLDEMTVRLPGLRNAGLQVIGMAVKSGRTIE